MFITHSPRRRLPDEAEKPFWISFADLMTALMVLFLVVMGVALLAVTRTVSEHERQTAQRQRDIDTLMDRFSAAAARHPGLSVDRERQVVDFGEQARFAFGSADLSPAQQVLLRQFVPEMLHLADDELGRRLLKRIVVEGYTDRAGSYLGNLDLSLRRSERVLCSMFARSGEARLDDAEKQRVRALFMVGGYSFNAARATDEASRRVEMRLEFLGHGERRADPADTSADFGECALP